MNIFLKKYSVQLFPPFRLSDSPGWTRCTSSVPLGYCLGCLHCTVMRVCPSHETVASAEALTQKSLCDCVEGMRVMKQPVQGSRGRAAIGAHITILGLSQQIPAPPACLASQKTHYRDRALPILTPYGGTGPSVSS